ncbi:MAG: FkbM family methyltransferase [Verrucomicrobiae bacterium]|nr:FkbM family methyltransferase [Verrucomicrobiae bacterium]
MKNPVANALVAYRTWSLMRRYPGVFTLADALMQIDRVLLPIRIYHRIARLALRRCTRIEQEPDGVWKICLLKHRLVFFWPQRPTFHTWYLIEQEFNPANPHCYTTHPVSLCRESVVIDVGACEGLFAFRIVKNGMAKRVICFEPFGTMAKLIRRGAASNGISTALEVEALAVGKTSGYVQFTAAPEADSGSVANAKTDSNRACAVSLDDYCASRGIDLRPSDLIKIDAEGADLDVLLGAERIISETGPQIAVTTYHKDNHCEQIVEWLQSKQPRYRLRLKGFSFWTDRPRPVLLLASRQATL